MINKLVPIIIGLLICLCPLPVLAAETGSIEVSLPKEMAGESINVTKEGEEKQTFHVGENGIVKVEGLEEGIYQIDIPETEEYTFTSAKVSIPTWSEEEHRMLYEVSMIPKYIKKEKQEERLSPLTGDNNVIHVYLGIVSISLIIMAIMSCHNRFDCDTMTGKYSKNGGHNNGNDNDTENPRRTRRIGLSSPGSID